ncbi:MAG TPA: CHRD domain-containing protein [Balneolales bacterium]|nr:CHRD domain-containing protein [Balneolales bacterium]
MKLSHISTFVLFTVLAIAGCSKKSGNMNKEQTMSQNATLSEMNEATASNSNFMADLSGSNEVPDAVTTNASGKAYFRVSNDSSRIYYTVDLAGADSVKMAHIHYGSSSQNGPIAVWLFPQDASPTLVPGPVNGTLQEGVIADSSLSGPFEGKKVIDLIHAMQHDSAYVQVHTAAHPEGEVRGQIKMK